MKILIVGHFLYPFGTASASRMRHFADGLAQAGADVRVISQNELYDRPEDVQPDGTRVYRGVPYESAAGYRSDTHREKRNALYRARWFWGWLRGGMRAARRVAEIVAAEPVDAIIQYNRSYVALQPFVKLCRRTGVALVQDVVEWPTPDFFRGGVLHPFWLDTKLALYRSIVQSDAVIGISQFLCDFYAERGLPTLRVPAVIDVPETMPDPGPPSPPDRPLNVTYLGSLSHRDGPDEMLGGVRLALDRGVKVEFNVVGSSGVAGDALLARQRCEADERLRPRVKFWGRVSDEEVVHRLQAADALLFVRPDDISARAAFPTRLPEYLTSGKPVMVAGVGDIPEYLRDGVDALVLRPCTAETVAAAIARLVALPDRGRAIGRSGFERARDVFDYRRLTADIHAFIQDIVARRRP